MYTGIQENSNILEFSQNHLEKGYRFLFGYEFRPGIGILLDWNETRYDRPLQNSVTPGNTIFRSLTLGLKYHFFSGRSFQPYFLAGSGNFILTTKHPTMGEVTSTASGFNMELGGDHRFNSHIAVGGGLRAGIFYFYKSEFQVQTLESRLVLDPGKFGSAVSLHLNFIYYF